MLNPESGYADTGMVTWFLVILVIVGVVAVLLGILSEGTSIRTRARSS